MVNEAFRPEQQASYRRAKSFAQANRYRIEDATEHFRVKVLRYNCIEQSRAIAMKFQAFGRANLANGFKLIEIIERTASFVHRVF
jgi:hypothetical protein